VQPSALSGKSRGHRAHATTFHHILWRRTGHDGCGREPMIPRFPAGASVTVG
jgi:hypothetical protein